MKKIVFTLLILLILIGLSLGIIIGLPDSGSPYYRVIDKQQLLKRTPSPKIILMGGSSLLFGQDSAALEAALGRPVINMGLNGGLGLRFMIEEIKPYLRFGDTILIVPEYLQFFAGFAQGDHNLWEYLHAHPSKWALTNSWSQRINLLKELPTYASRKVRRLLFQSRNTLNHGTYYSGKFTPQGDLSDVAGPTAPRLAQAPLFADAISAHDFNPQAITLLNQLAALAAAQQIQIYLIYPPIPNEHLQKNRELIYFIDAYLRQNLNFPLLASPEECSYPLSYFFDTVYHLNATGKRQRTQDLLQRLKGVIFSP